MTVPVPPPALLSVSVRTMGENEANTEMSSSMVTVQTGPFEESHPLQKWKFELAAGVAVKVKTVPLVSRSEQSSPQLIPAGLLETLPCPDPVLVTDRVL